MNSEGKGKPKIFSKQKSTSSQPLFLRIQISGSATQLY